MAHDPGQDAVLETVDHPVENEIIQDSEDDDKDKQVTKEGLMAEVKQDTKRRAIQRPGF